MQSVGLDKLTNLRYIPNKVKDIEPRLVWWHLPVSSALGRKELSILHITVKPSIKVLISVREKGIS